MYFPRIPASAITSHGSAVIFNFIITTAVVYIITTQWYMCKYQIMQISNIIPSLRAALLDKRASSLPSDKHCTEWFGLAHPDFSKSC